MIEWQGADGSVKPIAAIPIDIPRPDVAQALANHSFLESGFSEVVSKANIPGPGILSAWAIDNQKKIAYQLANTKPVSR